MGAETRNTESERKVSGIVDCITLGGRVIGNFDDVESEESVIASVISNVDCVESDGRAGGIVDCVESCQDTTQASQYEIGQEAAGQVAMDEEGAVVEVF